MALLDVARGDDRHTAERLTAEPVIWLGTVRPDGRPHHVPVWFAWHDPLVLIFSMPDTAKVRNLRASSSVSLSLDSADGAEIIELLRRLHNGGQTIILVTHDPAVAQAAGRIVRMRDGRVVTSDPASDPASASASASASGMI